MSMASFGVLSKKKIQDFIPPQTGLLRSMLRPLNLGPGGGLYNKPISHLQWSTMSQLTSGCVTCHTCHGCVTDFIPILGNPVEVAHMTSPGTVYISHAKGT